MVHRDILTLWITCDHVSNAKNQISIFEQNIYINKSVTLKFGLYIQ